jgi:inosine-uridine nucleoside N-ribohydrolase
MEYRKIPVILDTDIGIDIDDTWALALLLKSPELDIRLIVSATGDTVYRTKIIAKMLEIAERTDIPIGIGTPLENQPKPQAPWMKGYDLSRYPGTVHQDGVGAIIETIMASPEPVTLISIGPLPNIAAALARQPSISQHARFVGMLGSIRRGENGSPEPCAEYNVVKYAHACQAVFNAPWEMTITPLDTSGIVRLQGKKYRAVHDCDNPLIRAIIENYRIWIKNFEDAIKSGFNIEKESSILYDTVAIYLAFSKELLMMEKLPIHVTDDGHTIIQEGAKMINCATDWKDLSAFEDFLVQRLTGGIEWEN